MNTNLDTIRDLLEYIELHLDEDLSLDCIAKENGYSKYHLSRMFVNIVGLSVHGFIQRRRLTEAAYRLVFTDKSIMEIALLSGYETQQSFTKGFKMLYQKSPRVYRKKKEFYPIQLKYHVDGQQEWRGDRIMEVRIVNSDRMTLVGCKKSTRFGFFVIGMCWRNMHKKKHLISNRKEMEFLIGLNDYSNWEPEAKKQPAFDYYAAAEVDFVKDIPKGLEIKVLPEGRYVVFRYHAKREDSLQPVSDYIYKEWFPKSTCQLNEHARYDFAKYGETTDEEGKSLIEYWIPILAIESALP